MKKNKILKALGLFGCAILLVAVSIAGTLAFMTDSKTVTNTFTVGKVAITMDEAKVDLYGVAADPAARVTENTYKLIPNHTYVKDPTIHVDAASENCWLFVKVVNGISAIEAASDTTTIAKQLETNGWTLVAGETDVYAYKQTASAGENVVVFEKFVIADNVTNETLTNSYAAGVTVVVTGYAVQADGFTTAQDAWDETFGA